MSLLGVDVGTGSVKAGVFSADGECLATAYREYGMLAPQPGWACLDSQDVWQKTREVIADVASHTDSDPIRAMSVSSLGEAVVPLSADGRILDVSILSCDPRGGEVIEQIRSAMSPQAFYRINPNLLSHAYALPKIDWIRRHQPGLFEQTATFVLWDGLVGTLLGCEPFVSTSAANRTLLLDIRREDWSQELLDLVDLPREKLPRVLPAGSMAGTVTDTHADALGLPRGVKVIVGGHDQCVNALGAGVISPGQAVDGLGTYECITPVYDHIPEPEVMLPAGLNVEHHVVPGRYVSFLYNQGGALVRWFRDTFAADIADRPDVYERLMAEVPEAPTDLLVLPYFTATGPPDFVADASGVITGLHLDTTRGEILRAILESTSLYFCEGLEGLRQAGVALTELLASGGGARSDAWLQIKADVYGLPVRRLKMTEAGLAGAAMLAGMGTGEFASADDACKAFVRTGEVFEPNLAYRGHYDAQRERYQRLMPLLGEFLRNA